MRTGLVKMDQGEMGAPEGEVNMVLCSCRYTAEQQVV